MSSFREIREVCLVLFEEGVLTEEQFILLYLAYDSRNPEFPYALFNHVLDTTAKQLISRWRRVATAKHKFRTHSREVKSTSGRRRRVKKHQCLSSLIWQIGELERNL